MTDTVAPGAASPGTSSPGTSSPDTIAPPLVASTAPAPSGASALDAAGTPSTGTPSAGTPSTANAIDLNWVWREVRKRVVLKLGYKLVVADALAAAIPVVLDNDNFVVGFSAQHYSLAHSLTSEVVKNTIENILRQAAGRPIHFEVMEGTTLADWEDIKRRRDKAHAAVIAMAEQKAEAHHFEDVINQIVGEVRHHVSHIHDRMLPQVRAGLVLDVAASLADAEEALFAEADTRDGKRAMSRVIDRISTFLEVPPLTLALEVERSRRSHRAAR
jgi:hypothetical protein